MTNAEGYAKRYETQILLLLYILDEVWDYSGMTSVIFSVFMLLFIYYR